MIANNLNIRFPCKPTKIIQNKQQKKPSTDPYRVISSVDVYFFSNVRLKRVHVASNSTLNNGAEDAQTIRRQRAAMTFIVLVAFEGQR